MCIAVWRHCQIDQKQSSNKENYVQTMEFTCCLNMVFTWKSSRLYKVCLHDVMQQNFANRNDNLVMLLLTSKLFVEMTSLTFDFASWLHYVQRDSMFKIQLFSIHGGHRRAIVRWRKVRVILGNSVRNYPVKPLRPGRWQPTVHTYRQVFYFLLPVQHKPTW